MTNGEQTARRYDLDWLRVIAFFVLIYFHAAIFFIPAGLPLIQNDAHSEVLNVFVDISSQFRLALLFMISGAGVAFAMRRRTVREFIGERNQRLLLPFAFGMLFIVPPMVFVEKVFLGEFEGGYVDFMFNEYLFHGLYPAGNISWHHFWFIAYLYLFCLLGIGFYDRIGEARGRIGRELIAIRNKPVHIYGFVLVLVIPELFLRAVFPGFRDLIHDWASFVHWFLIFLAGFAFARNSFLLDSAERLRYLSLGNTVISLVLIYLIIGGADFDVPLHDPWLIPKYIVWCVLRMLFVWSILLTCFGFAARYLQFTNPVLAFLNESVYPLFILHLLVLVVAGYWIVQFSWGVWPKFLLLTSLTVVVVLAAYRYLIRPFNKLRLLFGVKPIDTVPTS